MKSCCDECWKNEGEKSMDIKLFEKANEMIRTFQYASFGVIDENGCPSVSAISLLNPENISELYFAATMDSNKVKRLQKNNQASINCYTSMNNITLVGETEIFSDQETKSKYWSAWQDWLALGQDVYPGGVSDPNYCFVKFTTKRVALWIDEAGAEFALDS